MSEVVGGFARAETFAFRLNKLPSGLSTDNVTKFLALSAS
jgi:hypothetical protein